jgi:hypothetical protein
MAAFLYSFLLFLHTVRQVEGLLLIALVEGCIPPINSIRKKPGLISVLGTVRIRHTEIVVNSEKVNFTNVRVPNAVNLFGENGGRQSTIWNSFISSKLYKVQIQVQRYTVVSINK